MALSVPHDIVLVAANQIPIVTNPCILYISIRYTVLYYTILYCNVMNCSFTVLYCTSLYHTIPYHTIPYHITPYHTTRKTTLLQRPTAQKRHSGAPCSRRVPGPRPSRGPRPSPTSPSPADWDSAAPGGDDGGYDGG